MIFFLITINNTYGCKSGSKILERYFESESHECYEILRTIKSTFFSSYPVANALDY